MTYQAYFDIDNQPISSGSGDHKIIIPRLSSGNEVIIAGTKYIMNITLVYGNGEQQTSENYTYIPEIKYLSL